RDQKDRENAKVALEETLRGRRTLEGQDTIEIALQLCRYHKESEPPEEALKHLSQMQPGLINNPEFVEMLRDVCLATINLYREQIKGSNAESLKSTIKDLERSVKNLDEKL